MNWLSILVPVYNVHPYLEECLTSVIEQAPADIQIVVLDDCSTDGSWELMQTLALRWPDRLQLLQHENNKGLSAARNSMIEAATGDYLWFLDSDDKILPGAIDHLQKIVSAHTPDIVLCDFSVWRARPRLKHRLRGEAHRRSFQGPAEQLVEDQGVLLSGLLSTGQMHAWSKVSKRSLWNQSLRFPPDRYFEDLMCMPQLALRCKNFYYCNRPWVAYRQRTTSILSNMTLSKASDQSAALLEFSRDLRRSPLHANDTVNLALSQQCARNFIAGIRFLKHHRNTLPPEKVTQCVDQFRDDFIQASPYSFRDLINIYIRRGWWLRAAKLYRFMHWNPNF